MERVREERKRRQEAEPGFKAGQALGEQAQATRMMLLPMEMAVAPVLVTLFGWWLDRRFGTSPLLVLTGLGVGLTVAVRAVMRAIKEVSR